MAKTDDGGAPDESGGQDRLDAKLRQLREAIAAEHAPERLLDLARTLQAAIEARRGKDGQEPGGRR